MKKSATIIITALMLSCQPLIGFASPSDDNEEQSFNSDLDFSVSIEIGKGHTNNPKTPILMPRVQQNGHTLYIISGCNGSTLVVLDEYGSEAFSTSITEDNSIVIIPNTISGSCELQIRRGAYCFYALIEL